jgi:hypothetical protein
MVQRLIRADLCDLEHEDGERPASNRLAIETNGQRYEIDVCDWHEAQAQESLAPWVAVGRLSAARRASVVIRRTAAQRRAADDIRRWARQQPEFGDIAELGRLPRAAIQAAHEAGVGLELTVR